MYKNITTKENYRKLLESGMFWEVYPELSGDWSEDESIVSPNKNGCKNCDNDFLKSDP
jgi:hypothetical protein